MNWIGFVILVVAASAAFFAGWWGCRGKRPGAQRVSAVLLAALVVSVWLRYHPAVEVRIFPTAYAYVRPWWSLVLGLAFLGSALPQLDEHRKRYPLGGLCVFLFSILTHQAAKTTALGPEDFSGTLDPEWLTCPQSTGFSCGAASAVTLLAQSGIRTSEAQMAQLCLTNTFTGTGEVGLLRGLRAQAADLGFTVELVEARMEDLDPTDLPAMACISLSPWMGHWVVLLDCDESTARIADPLTAEDRTTGGIRRVTRDELAPDFQGTLVRLRSKKNLDPPGGNG